MEPAEDAVRVLRHVCRLCRPGGIVLDLTTVPPAASMEANGSVVGLLDQEAFLRRAAITENAVTDAIARGVLVEERSVRFDVLRHFDDGAAAIEHTVGRQVTRLPDAMRLALEGVEGRVLERSWCLLRRLRVQ